MVRGLEINYDISSKEFVFGESRMSAPALNGKVQLRVLLDRASIELFANQGAVVSTNYAVPAPDNKSILISADSEVKINSLIINELRSIWPVKP